MPIEKLTTAFAVMKLKRPDSKGRGCGFVNELSDSSASFSSANSAIQKFKNAPSKVRKVLQKSQADALTFLRVKLRGEEIASTDGRAEFGSVIR
jgi:hypothetical protein